MFVMIPAQMAGQVLPVQMINEYQLIEEVLLAEIAPGMRQDLGLLVRARVSLLDVLLQLFVNVIESLLSYKDEPAFEAYFAKSLLMLVLEVLFKCLDIIEMMIRVATVYHALQLSKLLADCAHLRGLIVNVGVLVIDRKILLKLLELLKGQDGGLRNANLIADCLANRALFVVHDTS